MDAAWGGMAAAVSVLALFGGIALLMWVDARGKGQERQLAHTERLKALEVGRALPDADVARAQAEASRAWAAATVGFLVPLGVMGAAIGATALVFNHAESRVHLPLLATIWGVCGVVSLTAVASALACVRRQSRPGPAERRPDPAGAHADAPPPTGIREGPLGS